MPGDLDEKLYAELVRWRDEQARIAEVTKSSVMPNAILQRVATLRPTSIEQLLTVKSVGQDRASRWGEEILELVRGHMEKNFQ
jgi:DNA helicase-2/ATP-dependent DNA helicase PcrA